MLQKSTGEASPATYKRASRVLPLVDYDGFERTSELFSGDRKNALGPGEVLFQPGRAYN